MPRRSAVVFEPHNDDFIIGMGATGVELLNAGWDIVSVVMTDGRYGGLIGDPEQTIKARVAEKNQESDHLGTEWINIGYEDQSLGKISADPSRRNKVLSDLSDILERFDPSVAFVTTPIDGHPDHRATHDLVTAAIEQSQCETAVMEYTVWDVPFLSPDTIDTNQMLLVEVDETFEEKVSTIRIHESQLKEYPYDNMVTNFNRYLENIYHQKCEAEFVEVFHVKRHQTTISDFIESVDAIDVTSVFHADNATSK